MKPALHTLAAIILVLSLAASAAADPHEDAAGVYDSRVFRNWSREGFHAGRYVR